MYIKGNEIYLQLENVQEEIQVEVTKKDWKLYREKIEIWQEKYMERLVKEYAEYLNSSESASNKFWELEERINKDKKRPGVRIELNKRDMPFDLMRLLNDEVITFDDLEDFSDELKEYVQFVSERLG